MAKKINENTLKQIVQKAINEMFDSANSVELATLADEMDKRGHKENADKVRDAQKKAKKPSFYDDTKHNLMRMAGGHTYASRFYHGKDGDRTDARLEECVSRNVRNAIKKSLNESAENNGLDDNQIMALAQIMVAKYGHNNTVDLSNPEQTINDVKYVMRSERCDEIKALQYLCGVFGGGWG